MRTLRIHRIKPNPAGKDRASSGPLSPAQLGAEWIDIQNNGSATVNTAGIDLYHLAYGSGLGSTVTDQLVVRLPDYALKPNQVLRVHAGEQRDPSVLYEADGTGADWHSFTGRDAYVWNNLKGDTAKLKEARDAQTFDAASYDPNPPEGKVLRRLVHKLIP